MTKCFSCDLLLPLSIPGMAPWQALALREWRAQCCCPKGQRMLSRAWLQPYFLANPGCCERVLPLLGIVAWGHLRGWGAGPWGHTGQPQASSALRGQEGEGCSAEYEWEAALVAEDVDGGISPRKLCNSWLHWGVKGEHQPFRPFIRERAE